MAKPQQPELHRSGLTPADPGSAKVHRQGEEHVTTGGGEGTGPIPEDNRPGHHPDVEQDKPVERFAAKARQLADEAHHHGDEPAAHAAEVHRSVPEDVPAEPALEPEARHTGAEDLAGPSPAAGETAPGGERGGHQTNPLVAPALAAWGLVRNEAAPLVAVPPLAALDALRRPALEWTEIDESKPGWVARIVLVPFVGAWQYATTVRPRLEGAAVALRLRGG